MKCKQKRNGIFYDKWIFAGEEQKEMEPLPASIV